MSRQDEREREASRLRRLKQRQPKTDDFPGTGVVLSDGIEFYCKQFDLIEPMYHDNLKPANYKLRVGDEYAIGGNIGRLVDERGRDEIIIPPFEVAVIKTLETINMPRFLIGRWNIKVQLAYQGLLWVGGPQVDSGYVGHLFCPIYNLSNKAVALSYGETFAVIDFVKTTYFHDGESLPYSPVPDRLIFEDYNPTNLRSALSEQITQFREQMRHLEKTSNDRIRRLESITWTGLSIVFAALAVITTSNLSTAINIWTFLAFGVSILAILIALGK